MPQPGLQLPRSVAALLLALATSAAAAGVAAAGTEAASAGAGDEGWSRPGVQAGQAPDTLDRVIRLPEITVRATRSYGDLPTPLRRTLTFSALESRERLALGTPDVLASEPEILIQKTTLGGGSPVIRGLIGNRVLALVDGIRLNNSIFRFGPNQYLNTVAPSQFERIEVLAGPGSVMYGSDALGGVINVESREPSPHHPAMEYRGTVDAPDGSHTHAVLLNRWGGRGGLLVGGGYRSLGDLRAGGARGTQTPTGYSEWSAQARLLRLVGQADRFTLAAQTNRQEDVPRYDRLAARQDSLNVYDPQNRDLVFARYEARNVARRLESLQATVSWNHMREGRRTISRQNLVRLQSAEDEVHTWGGAVEARSVVAPRSFVIWGGETYRDVVASRSSDRNLTTGVVTPVIGKLPDDGEHRTTALFARLQHRLVGAATVSGSLRYSRLALQGTPQGPFGKVRLDNHRVTAGGEIGYEPRPGRNVYLSLAQAFRAPGMEDALATGLTSRGWDVPNPALRPEGGWTVESGLVWRDGSNPGPGRLHLTGSVWYSELQDVMERVPALWNGQTTLDGEPVFRIANAGHGRLAGVSASVSVPLASAWSATSAVAWTWGEKFGARDPLGRIPPARGNARLAWFGGTRRLELVGDWALRQSRLSADDRRDTRIPKGGTPGYVAVHVRSTHDLGPRMSLQVALENILDQNYRTHGSGIDMPGRTLRLGLGWRTDDRPAE